ncbi:MAG TPA: hypothetical protein VK149_12120 [Sideroxyarcus sp.]|nr:hypothetical protein [Sideroxyarcus sp.]
MKSLQLALQLVGLAVFIVGMLSIGIRLLLWAMDVDVFHIEEDEEI